MKDIYKILKENGPMPSSILADKLFKKGFSRVASRKKISRALNDNQSLIQNLSGLNLPHNVNFIFLKKEGRSDRFYNNLWKYLNETNSSFCHIINLLRVHYGIVNKGRINVYTSAPDALKKRLSNNQVIDTLIKLQLCEYKKINQNEYLYLTYEYNEKRAIAQEKIELLLIELLKNWLKKVNIGSYEAIDKKNELVGHFAWDITSPCYISPFVVNNKQKHGFVVADVVYEVIDENVIKYFINKVDSIKSQQRILPVLPIILAKGYNTKAFKMGRNKGIIIVTPESLFGEDLANMFEDLLIKLSNIAACAVKDFEGFLTLFDKLEKIQSSAAHLYGDLFEFIVGTIYREFLPITSFEIGKLVHISTGNKREIDVYIKTSNNAVYFIECKGYSQKTMVNENEAKYWIEKVPLLRKWGLENIENFDKLEQHYEFITTSDFTSKAKEVFEEFNKRTKKYQVVYLNGQQLLELIKLKNINSKDKIIKTLNEHYFKMEI